MARPSRARGALLPGNAKRQQVTDLPALVAVSALGTSWFNADHLGEIHAMGLLWSILGSDGVGQEILTRVTAIDTRATAAGGYAATPDEISFLQDKVPLVVAAISQTPNHLVDLAIRRAQAMPAAG